MTAKTEFVRSQPSTASAKEVVAAAQAAGIDLSVAHVHVIRSKDRKSPETTRKPIAEILDWTEGEEGLERDLMMVAVELGFSRSTQLLDEFRSEIRSRRIG